MGGQMDLPDAATANPNWRLDRFLRPWAASICGWPTTSTPKPGSTSNCLAGLGLMLLFIAGAGAVPQPLCQRHRQRKGPPGMNTPRHHCPQHGTAPARKAQPTALQVLDESHAHDGHAPGANGTGFGTHFRVRIASPMFTLFCPRTPASPYCMMRCRIH